MGKQLGEAMEYVKHLTLMVEIPFTPLMLKFKNSDEERPAFKAVIGDVPCVGYLVRGSDDYCYWLGYIAKLPGLVFTAPKGDWTFEGVSPVIAKTAGLREDIEWLGMDTCHPFFVIYEGESGEPSFRYLISELYNSVAQGK